MIDWEEVKRKYRDGFARSSDEVLIKSFNREVGCGGWGTARMWYLHYLSREIRRREFNSDIIFDLDEKGNIKSMKLSKKVEINDNNLRFVKY